MERCIVACHNAKLALLPATHMRCRYCLRKPQGFLYAEPEIDRGRVVCGLAIYPEGGSLMPCQRGEYRFRQERIFVEAGRQNEEAENSPADCFLTRSGQDPSGTGGKGWPWRAAILFPVNRHGCISSRESAAFQGRTQYRVTLNGRISGKSCPGKGCRSDTFFSEECRNGTYV